MENHTYKATVNAQFEFSELGAGALDIIVENAHIFHILKNNQSFRAEVVHTDFTNKSFTIKINGNSYDIKLEDQYDQLINRLGLTKQTHYKVKDIKAPMPGLVLSVNVEPGQQIQRGDALLILEAMKMENVIKSPGDGIVKKINVEKGAAVEKGYLLIEME
ncbi:MAG: acetyl-CoA carboxylase biotin carboxyl carrier protein subunit [Saprospiraceae bacterium]|nr:acetyl-CoA carboxylase biotin carboxyl carrier protein subunit [Saprospiraceae bacterium]